MPTEGKKTASTDLKGQKNHTWDPSSDISSVLPLSGLRVCDCSKLTTWITHMLFPHQIKAHRQANVRLFRNEDTFQALSDSPQPHMGLKGEDRLCEDDTEVKNLFAANKPYLANILLNLISQKRGTVHTKTTLGHAARTSSIYGKVCTRALGAYQSYRDLGPC